MQKPKRAYKKPVLKSHGSEAVKLEFLMRKDKSELERLREFYGIEFRAKKAKLGEIMRVRKLAIEDVKNMPVYEDIMLLRHKLSLVASAIKIKKRTESE